MNSQACDIIIPVYNAPDEVKDCIKSIFRNTDNVDFRVIIINDCSPDPEVKRYLETIKEESRIVLLENEKNLGFVGTVNRGMSYSENDVVLLNSDTVVTKDWLKKLIEAAYSDESIATITPLTNNGTICSVPNFCEDNSLPDGFTIDSFAHFVEKISLRLYPEIPTAVGFCMYIKRNVIREIGLFDLEAFGKGYGEENDFCCRVIEYGYKNILADNIYIYHKGSMSFQGEKLNLVQKNSKLLNQRYPYYERNVHEFITSNPLRPIHDNISIRMKEFRHSEHSKGNILFVLQNFFDEAYNHPVGGTEYHVKDLISNLTGYNAYILVTNGTEIVVKQYRAGKLVTRIRFPLMEPIKSTHFHHKEYSDMIETIIQLLDIGLIHIHHLLRHTFDIPYVATKHGIKVIYTLHDYHLFCPKTNLLDENNHYCKDIRSEQKCRACLNERFGYNTPFINQWKRQVEKMMACVDQFITPSNSTAKLYVEEFPQLNGKIRTIEHGADVSGTIKKKTTPKSTPLKIGFLGGLSPTKGSDMIYQLIKQYSKEKVQWHLVGGIGDQRINLLSQTNLFKHGEYKREEIGNILKEIELDIICFLSPGPETFSYTLSEAWKNGIPVLVTPLGALKERVERVGAGFVAKGTDIASIKSAINHILTADKEEWKPINDALGSYNGKTIDQMTENYREIYDGNYTAKSYIPNVNQNQQILNGLKYYLPNSGMSKLDYDNSIDDLQQELKAIKETIGWKVLDRLRRRKHWSLTLGKKAIYLALKIKKRTR
jgi:GT2 family glycosyltransferase/glycosyltransferase involved in cell wall biosynthesis